MALGVNIQWGYAGLFNVGVMGFAALGGLAGVVVSMPPVDAAWAAGGLGIIMGLATGIATLIAGMMVWRRGQSWGRRRYAATAAIVISGYILMRSMADPSVAAIEAVDPARTGEDGKFYFLEKNTRVQVEHPVSEMVTGVDIIKEQIWIAFSGETALEQKDINPRGHAIECRINAEDASKNFQPSPGTIGMCHQPSGFRTRVDGAIFQGYKVTPFYDSMICKLICHGRDRTEAIQRMNRCLDEFVIEGITTTIPLHKTLLKHKKFLDSDYNVSWLDNEKVI